MFAQQNLYTLSKYSDSNFFRVRHNRDKIYKVAFPSVYHVRHIQYGINPIQPNMRLLFEKEKRKNINIGYVICQELQIDLGNIFYTPNVILKIDKKSEKQRTYQKEFANELMFHINLEEENINQFITNPLMKDIGIIIPYKIEEENINAVSFRCHAIYPESYLENNYYKNYKVKISNLLRKTI